MIDDVPLVPDDSAEPRIAELIDLDAVRIRWGQPKRGQTSCPHNTLIYSDKERRVWCEDCQRTIDNFDVVLKMIRQYQGMLRAARVKMQKADEAMTSTVRKRAAKQLDRIWSGNMLPTCPRCNVALWPEDFADGAATVVSREFEQARRARDKKP